MEQEKTCNCLECEAREKAHKESEDMNFAVLVALMPLMALTVFSSIGLI